MKINFTLLLVFFTLAGNSFAQPGLTWGKGTGGGGSDLTRAMVRDASGNIYLIGEFNSSADFDPGIGTTTIPTHGGKDAWVVKLDASGNFVWAGNAGGANDDWATGVAVTAAGKVIITGYCDGTADFDPTSGTNNVTNTGFTMFVWCLDPGGTLSWVKTITAGSVMNSINDVVLDGSGNIFMTGTFSGTVDFDPGANMSNLNSAGLLDVFVWKLDANGLFGWAKNMGGSGDDIGYGIALDGSGNVVTTGEFKGTAADFDPDAGTANLAAPPPYKNAYVSKLSGTGTFVWAKAFGGNSSNDVQGTDLVLDAPGNVYCTGNFSGIADFDPGAGAAGLTTAFLSFEAYCVKLDGSGNYTWAKEIDGTVQAKHEFIALDGFNNVYIYGEYGGNADFDPGANHAPRPEVGSLDVFVLKLTTGGNYSWHIGFGNVTYEFAAGVSADVTGIYIAGSHDDSMDVDPGAPFVMLTSLGNEDVFLLKLHECTIPINVGISILGATITANATGAEYQWVDCDAQFFPVFGSNGQSFTPQTTGNFAVIVSEAGCYDTSLCQYAISVDPSILDESFEIFPNPAYGTFTVLTRGFSAGQLEIFDLRGQPVYSEIPQSETTVIQSRNLASGIYLVRVSHNGAQAVRKVWVE